MIVVGAGVAGLTAAQALYRHGYTVTVYEASGRVGGRVRSERTADGFTLDHGFQVLFTAYPALRRHVDLHTLDLRPFDNGAAVVTPSGPRFLRDPMRHVWDAPTALTSRLLTWGDRLRLARLGADVLLARWDGAREALPKTMSIERYLRQRGFSESALENFFRPFLAGLRLRRDLDVEAAVALFDLKMLVSGRAAIPAAGMQAVPDALARSLPVGSIHLSTPVQDILRNDRRVTGVRTVAGETSADAVVLAVDGDALRALTGWAAPSVTLGSATVYLAGREQPHRHKLVALNALADPFVNDASLLTNVAPEYAPPGWHLLGAHVLDSAEYDDDMLEARARADVQRWFPHVNFSTWRTLAVVRTPHSQYPQLPGASSRVEYRSPWSRCLVAGEIAEDSSINGAMRSGEWAARLVENDLGSR
ncbi:MAG: NAD(P)/FAD-dependent oxidoreductase [Chloroflexota bacterium]